MQKSIEKLIPHDKALHLIACLLMGGVLTASLVLLGISNLLAIFVIPFIFTQVPIFIKEWYDQWRKEKRGEGSGFSWMDILWGEIGLFIILTYTIILLK